MALKFPSFCCDMASSAFHCRHCVVNRTPPSSTCLKTRDPKSVCYLSCGQRYMTFTGQRQRCSRLRVVKWRCWCNGRYDHAVLRVLIRHLHLVTLRAAAHAAITQTCDSMAGRQASMQILEDDSATSDDRDADHSEDMARRSSGAASQQEAEPNFCDIPADLQVEQQVMVERCALQVPAGCVLGQRLNGAVLLLQERIMDRAVRWAQEGLKSCRLLQS